MADVIDDVISELKTPGQRKLFLQIAESALAKAEPLSVIRNGNLFIKTKRGTLEKFMPNKAQLYLLDQIELLLKAGKPVRVLILKARQMGMSTLVEAIIYVMTAFQENTNSLIVAHDDDAASGIFEMSKLFHEKIPAHLKQPEKKSNAKELVFDKTHSLIVIDTANNASIGRSFTFRICHLSEYAFYKKHDTMMAGLNQTIPNLPGTMIIKETTANGFNFFRDEWNDAIEGKNDFVPIFFPWYWDSDYAMPVVAGHILDADEMILRAKMRDESIDRIEERLAWRAWAIKNLCRNNVEIFNQEYPASAHDAFLASGKCIFDKHALLKRLAQIERAKQQDAWYAKRFDIVESKNEFELRESENGAFTFFEKPEESGKFSDEFYVAGDASGGASADYSVLEVRRKKDNKQIAMFRGKVAPSELERHAYMLGSFFNDAIVAIENDKFGFATNQALKQHYGYVYMQERVESDGAVTSKYGWDTNSVTRPMMLSALEEDIRQGALDINDEHFIKECLTFVYNEEKNRAEAESGQNDDCVMTMAINSALRRMHPWTPTSTRLPGQPIEDKPKNRGYKF